MPFFIYENLFYDRRKLKHRIGDKRKSIERVFDKKPRQEKESNKKMKNIRKQEKLKNLSSGFSFGFGNFS